MGLFDKIPSSGGGKPVLLSKAEAFAGIMLAVMNADGDIADEEFVAFQAVIARLPFFKEQSGEEHTAMTDKLLAIMEKNNAGYLLTKSAEALPQEYREAAFAVATDLVFSDGNIADEEKAILEQAQRNLQISDELAGQIVRVMEIKYRS